VIVIATAEPIQNFRQSVFVLIEELSAPVSAKTEMVMKLVSPREVSIRREEHTWRILRFVLEMKVIDLAEVVGWV
jgi:hypothetical protein